MVVCTSSLLIFGKKKYSVYEINMKFDGGMIIDWR